jgi:hypothetical protein
MAEPTAFDDLIVANAMRVGIDVDLFRRLIAQESNFNPSAVSPKGAGGLGQVMPDTARDPGYGVRPLAAEDLMDPAENIRFSADFLGAMINEFDRDIPLALAAYNAGPGNVKKYGGIPPFEETQNYVNILLGSPAARVPPERSSGRPVARPSSEEQASNNSFLDSLPDALAYLDLSGMMETPRTQMLDSSVRRPAAGSGTRALKQMGLASLV